MKTEIKIAIIGSCVTRDCFKHMEGELKNCKILYIARTGLISIMSDVSIDIKEEEVNLNGGFERKTVISNISKRAMSDLEEFKPDVILLDLIDERFDLIKYKSGWYAKSNYLVNCGFLEKMNGYETIKKVGQMELWNSSLINFSKRVSSISKNVILHKTHWASSYMNKDTHLVEKFKDSEMAVASKSNELLDYFYIKVEGAIENLSIINYDENLLYSDFAHEWGKDYFHFGERYYKDVARKIEEEIEGMSL